MAPASDPARRTVRDVPVAATVCLVAIGLLFTILAIIYFAEPAHDLPGLIPGSDKDITRHHIKHGLASLAAGIAALLAAVFSAGGRPAPAPGQRGAHRSADGAGDDDTADDDDWGAADLQQVDDLLWEDGAPASLDPPAQPAGTASTGEEAPSGQR
jgi:hypothetical protein